jgi:hypothetical protein
MSVDLNGQIRRGFFEQGRPMKEIVRTLSASLAHLGDGAQLLLAAGRHLPRREPQPGRKIPRAFEVLREWRQCRKAVAAIGPMAGIFMSRRATSSSRARFFIS